MATRRERVILDLEDQLSAGMVKAAASTALLKRELNSLSHDSVRTRSAVSDIDRPVRNVGRSSNDASREVDKLSGRMRILADVALILGPSLVPIGAVGIPAVTGLAAQLGFAATGAGVAVLAFQGIGNTLKALNAAALDPTTQNLQKAQIALEGLSPAAQGFVAQLGAMLPELRQLRDLAADGLFPGATTGLRSLETALPHVQALIAAVSAELGDIAANAGSSLASPRWTAFLDFLAQNAPQALGEMAKAAGNTAHAVAALWMATDPLNDDFSSWLVKATGRLDDFASGLSKTQGYAEFIAYVEKNGPQVGKTLGAIANAALQIVEATAPLGGPVLKGIEALANVVGSIADSDLGTPLFTAAAALALFNRTMAVTGSLQKATFGGPALASIKGMGSGLRGLSADLALVNRESALMSRPGKGFIGPLTQAQTAMGRIRASAATFGKTAALIGGVGVASSGAADKIHLTNTASLALMGTFISPGWGTAIGGAAGLFLDAAHASDSFTDSMKRADAAIKSGDLSDLESVAADLGRQKKTAQSAGAVVPARGQAGVFIQASATDKKLADVQTKLDMTKAIGQQKLLAAGFIGTAAGIDRAGQSTKEFQADLQKLNDVLSGRANLRDYEAALDDFRKSLKENGKTLDVNTEKGRNNQASLDAIASSALTMAEKLKGVDRVKFLSAARRQFIDAARDAGMTRKAARDLANQVLGLNGVKGQPKIVISPSGAWRVIDETAARLSRLTRATYILNIRAQMTGKIPQVLDAQAQAEGGTVLGPRYPYGDKVLTALAPGEEVITNRHGEADRFRRDRAAGRIPAYANGGTVDSLLFSTHSRTHLNETPRQELKRFKRALEESTKAIENEKSKRDSLVQARDSLASTVSGQFTSDIFASRITGGNHLTQDPMDALRADIAKANEFRASLGALSSKGLTGQAFQALAETGDVKRAQAFAALSPTEIAQYQALYNQRAQAADSTGAFAGNTVYAAGIGQSNKHLATLVAENKILNHKIDRLEAAIKHAGKNAGQVIVHDKSGNPKHTAREVSRRQHWAGAN